jgi:tetratricopeptide (TPR) repeat protein
VKSSFKFRITLWLATLPVAVSISLLVSPVWAQAGQTKGTSQSTPLQVQPRVAESEEIHLRFGQLPEVTLTSSLLFRILAAEIAAQRGSFLSAGKTMLELAREVGDYRLARRALEFYLGGGNLPGALDSARVWLRITPDDPEAASTEMTLAAASGQTSGLATALRKQIDATADKNVGIAQAAHILSRMPDKRNALSILSTAIAESTARNTLAAHLALADMASAAADRERALEEARKALAVAPRSEEAAMRVFEYGLGVDPAVALRDAAAFAAAQPQARRLRLMMVSHMTDLRQYDTAMNELQSMAKRSPEDFDLLFVQAQVAYRAKKLEQARGFLEQFVTVQTQRQRGSAPGATDAPSALAEAYQLYAQIADEQGKLDEAVSLLAKIEDPSARYSARIKQAMIRARQNRVDEAIALIDSGSPQTDDERILGFSAGAQILRDADRLGDAIKRLNAANKEMPDTIEIKYELAMLYERENKMRDTEKLLREVIALEPGHAHAHNALGYSLADRNQRLPEALELITRALSLAPKDPFILDSMGWVKFRMGDNQQALEYLEQAYAKRPEADIAAHLAEVLWRLGRRDEAQKYLKEGAQRDPKNPTLIDTAKRLGVRL